MGIQGLLPLLKDIQVQTSISKYSGLTVGIDAYCWLHKGGYCCAKELVMKKPTDLYIHYVMRRVHMLINHNITPILVFDGGYLPAKADTEKERRKRRTDHRVRGMAALKQGNTKEAYEQFQRCYDVTPEMACEVIQQCYALNVQCIVAPYEADAQLAYLMKEGITQLTISEDSDLLLYGCNKVMYKMSIDGDGLVIDIDDLKNVRTVQLASFTFEKFRHMCMLSGCDYLPSIKGMGLIKAFKSLRRHSNVFQCIRSLKCDRTYTVPKDYEENFRKAGLVFKYQLVFDIRSKHLVRLNTIDESDVLTDADIHFAGPNLDDAKGLQIALGNIDPISNKCLADRLNFASGDISSKVKSTSWGSPSPNIPKPNHNTAFGFHGKLTESPPEQKQKNSQRPKQNAAKILVKDSPAAVVDSPKTEAIKSLKRLRDDEVTVPTREDKIRKLYKEENEEEDTDDTKEEKEIALCKVSSASQRHHSVFTKKSHKFKNPFRQVNQEPSDAIVVSRFFGNKISSAKENNMQGVECLSPEEITTANATNVSTEKPQLEGSFLEYLDNTNVRTCDVPRHILTLSSPKKSQKKIDIYSPRKTKRVNIFSTSKNESTISPKIEKLSPLHSPGDNIDFNITIPLDDDDVELDILPSETKASSCDQGDAKAVNNNKKVNLKLGLCRNNIKGSSVTNSNMFSRFKCKPKQNAFSTKLSKSEVIDAAESNTDITSKVVSHCESVEVSETGEIADLDVEQLTSVLEKDQLNMDKKLCEENEINEVEAIIHDVEAIPSQPQTYSDIETDNIDSFDKSEIIDVDETAELDEEPLPSYTGKNGDVKRKQQPTGVTIDLNEEVLPSRSERDDVRTEDCNDIDGKEDDVEVTKIVYLDEEPLPFNSERNQAVMELVKNTALSMKTGTKRCKPIGLNRKRKSMDKATSNDNLKQLTFDRFTFKKKSIPRSDAVDIICLS